jgi:hypothetical protein
VQAYSGGKGSQTAWTASHAIVSVDAAWRKFLFDADLQLE